MAKKPIGWLTRDKDGAVWFWVGTQPVKEELEFNNWLPKDTSGHYIRLGECKQMKMVKWSDEKPRAVEDFILLGEAE